MKTMMILALVAGAAAQIEISRTVESILPGASGTVILSSGCTGMDMYGSNDCTLNWGSNYTGTAKVVLPVAIDTGSTVDMNVKLDGLIDFKVNCPLCGGNCTFTVPVVKKHIDQPMPPCPLIGAGSYDNSTVIELPTPSPVPSKVSFKGTAIIKDGKGETLISLKFEGSAK
eukprot:TRINITY_DN33548_c1_g1_i1.p1 TRINITY_DN33548_c1_g1~~TRINITY_DN33548_c1_g1_i1.p1  ORF type:complete len:171 (+),score=36.13 TRINITY_DN33548_c1_g1_i1:53-565(+)